MKPRQIVSPLALLLITLSAARISAAQEAPLQGFDDYVNKARAEWAVPGLAVAVVKDDKVVFARGYGVRKLGDPAPVNERTIFAIGSATKAFTAAALAMLVDEGKIRWDDPVTKHLKGFQLYDAYVTREITVRDLLCHRSGLDRGEALWYGSNLDANEILRRIRYQKPAWSFRSHFGYNNIMFLAAGRIIPAVTGRSWEDFVRDRILAPLGMTSTSTSVAALKNFDNVATPHTRTAGEVKPIAWRANDNVAPAGSICSSVSDMARWLRLQLAQGSYEDKKLLSLGAVEEMQKPQMIVPYDAGTALGAPDARFMNYGFGWFLHDYHGRKVVRHGGNIDGMVAMVGMIPEEKLGVVILSNLDPGDLPSALMYRAFDAYLGLPAQDWSARMLKVMRIAEARRKAEAKRDEELRVRNTRPSLSPGAYAGTYRNDFYGEVKVTEQQGRLLFYYNEVYSGELEHWHYDTFRITWGGAGTGDAFVTFTLSAQGRADEMKVQKLDDFKRVPESASARK
ncbi:MAG TPA: serine hydrolase [Blastocatellia bacterium]|nr:serine hydrolase [Blastocatellia bacterium]